MTFKSIIGKARLVLSLATAVLALVVSIAAIVPMVSCSTDEDLSPVNPALSMDLAWDLADEATDGTEPTSAAPAADTAIVYFTDDISAAGIMKIYDAMGVKPAAGEKVAIKIHTGEPRSAGNLYSLSPSLINPFAKSVNGTYVETNIAPDIARMISAKRYTEDAHMQVARDHGYHTDSTTVVIMDGKDDTTIAAVRGGRLKGENIVGKRISQFDFHIVLSHFKGHQMGGFGGTLKNLSIGYGSSAGKCWIHSAGSSKTTAVGGTSQTAFTESMAEAAKSIVDYANRKGNGQKIVFINVLNNLTIDCDCMATAAAPKIPDIGIMGSLDPVALDQASVDEVKKSKYASNNQDLLSRIRQQDGENTITHAATLGLGTKLYKIVDVNDMTSIKERERVVR